MNDRHARYVVSACLAGLFCRYDGGSNPCPEVVALYQAGLAIPICPESLSGLPIPREPCEQREGKVFSRSGENLTALFELGAGRAFALAKASGCGAAILKSKSPSCGHGEIYDGTFSKTLLPGNGLWTQKLLAAGFLIYDEHHLPPELR